MTLLSVAVFSLLAGQARADFPDVPQDHWAYDAVSYLESEGFIVGYPDGTYRGARTLTRYEFAMVISRLYDQFLTMVEENEPPGIDVQAILDMLMKEFQPELDELRALIALNTARIESLEISSDEVTDSVAEISGRIDRMDKRFSPFGDLTLRFYGVYPDEGLQSQRPFMMFRWGFTSKINDELTLGARLTSGPEGGRQSAFDAFEDHFGYDDINIDRAYMQWRPSGIPGFTMWGGKFSPPWKIAPIVFDADVTFEGLAQHFNHDNFNFYLAELTPVEKGFYLIAQAGYNNLFTDNFNVALTYHYINDDAFEFIRSRMESGTLKSYWDFSRLESPDDYRAFEVYAEYGDTAGELPFKIQGDYLINLEPSASDLEDGNGWQKAAWARLTILNPPREPGDFNFWAEWGKVQANSVLTWLTDSARGSGDTEFWVIGWNYRLMQNTDLAVSYYDLKRLSIDSNSTAIVVDLTSRFN